MDVLQQLLALSQPQYQQQSGFGQVLQGLQGLANAQTQNQSLKHLSALAGAAPQYYAGQYGSALGQIATPDPQAALKQKYLEAQIQNMNDPFERLAKLQQLSISQQNADSISEKNLLDKQQRQQIQNILGGGGPYAPPVTDDPKKISPLASYDAPLNERNKNPGNLKDPRTGEFRKFSTPEEGYAANLAELQLKISGDSPVMKAKFGKNYTANLKNLISTWAPSSDNNDPEAYAKYVSEKTGIPVDKKLELEDAARILPAMAQFEGGQAYKPPSALANIPQPTINSVIEQTNALQQPTQPTALEQFQPSDQLLKLQQAAMIDPSYVPLANSQMSLEKTQYDTRIENQRKFEEKAVKERDKVTKDKKELTEAEGSLRKEFEGLPDVKDFRTVEASFQRLSNATKKPSAAGDIAMIFNYMKMLDPGSTVREGEFATAQNAAGVPDQIRNQWNKILNGERLNPAQRQDFVSQAYGQYKAAEDLFTERANQYEGIASQYEFDPKRVVQRSRGKVETPKDPGSLTVNGYTFPNQEAADAFRKAIGQ